MASLPAPRPRRRPRRLATICRLLAECAGLAHDLGKFGNWFQGKLTCAQAVADPIRHEWLSMHVLRMCRKGATWQEAWAAPVTRMPDLMESGLQNGVTDVRMALDVLVCTHHRLPDGPGRRLSDENYLSGEADTPTPAGTPDAALWSRLQILQRRLDRLAAGERDPLFWRAAVTRARVALLIADHGVSSRELLMKGRRGAVYANSVVRSGGRVKNQLLDWHLAAVSQRAAEVAPSMGSHPWPVLSQAAATALREPAREPAFEWQNRAAAALQSVPRVPCLVLNQAGTGCGKTRMNAKAIAHLRLTEPVRITSAFNLVTLTKQSHEAYREQLGIDTAELACVVGNRAIVQKHHASVSALHLGAAPPFQRGASAPDPRQPGEEDDGIGCDDYEVLSSDAGTTPRWLAPFVKRRPKLGPLLAAPVTLCTVDFLEPAGDLTRRADHALAMLRLASSDLILDEIDGYAPVALVAVLRLVTCAAMWGRHVVASSATLSPAVARALWLAYDLGARMRGAVEGECSWCQVIIDELSPPTVAAATDLEQFAMIHQEHTRSSLARLGRRCFRPVRLQDVHGTGFPALAQAIEAAVQDLHTHHRQPCPAVAHGHEASFGLVRVASIRTAVAVARHLAATVPFARVCCYHSQLGAAQRLHVEQTLDRLLNRKPSSAAIHQEAFAAAAAPFLSADQPHTAFIVVATPVEEIGRDHDFDWAVVEPSSIHSIVQVCGRVNRHRLLMLDSPNVALLRYNLRHLLGAREAFQFPGLESTDWPYPAHHDLALLIDWDALAENGQVDARARFEVDKHELARLDERVSAELLAKHLRALGSDNRPDWLRANVYTEARLREPLSHVESWSRRADGAYVELCRKGRGWEYLERDSNIERVPRSPRDWLALDDEQLEAFGRANGLDLHDAFRVEIARRRRVRSRVHDQSFGYYFD